MKYKFEVTQTDVYKKTLEFEADSLFDAHVLCEKDLEVIPLDSRSNTLESSEFDIQPIPVVHSLEGLFDPDNENDQGVIRVSELSDQQRQYLGIPLAEF